MIEDVEREGNVVPIEAAKKSRGAPKPTVATAISILANDSRWKNKIAWNELAQEIELDAPPWHIDDAETTARVKKIVSDVDIIRLQAWLIRNCDVTLARETVRDAAMVVAERRRVHPIRDWLRDLRWDGEKRVDGWLAAYVGAENGAYASNVGRWFLVGAVGRVMRPGCKLDTMPTFEGDQGAGKSTMLRVLFGDAWFSDTPLELQSKDRFVGLRGKWCVEFAELDSVGRSEIERVKNFLSSSVDSYRPPYGRGLVDVPRQAVFAGTTNRDDYLRDETGNRRFFPVRCGRIDLEGLHAAREQLWAEAFAIWESGGIWHPRPDELGDVVAEQGSRLSRDAWADEIATWLIGHPLNELTVSSVLRDVFALERAKWTMGDQARVARALKVLGWTRQRAPRGAGGVPRGWVYRRSAEMS